MKRPRSFSLDELTRVFPRHEVTATLVCAGLRRREFLSLGPLPGELPWGPEPASTGQWAGIALTDLLQAVGPRSAAQHVEFAGLDHVERQGQTFGFGGSVALEKALSSEVVLATHLNGEPLPPRHGFPVRAIVPGWIGARSVKWLGRITLLEKPSSNYFQSKAYRMQREINPLDPRDVSGGDALDKVPLNAVILSPGSEMIAAGAVRVRGWAMGSGGASVTEVWVTPDGGDQWIPAHISRSGTAWAWSLWEVTLQLPPGQHTLAIRATDTTGARQPETLDAAWNVKGYNNNAWHRVTVHAV